MTCKAVSSSLLPRTHPAYSTQSSVSADGTRLATLNYHSSKLWDLPRETAPAAVLSDAFGEMSVLSPNGELIAAWIDKPFVFPVADPAAGLKLPRRWREAAWSPDSKRLAALVDEAAGTVFRYSRLTRENRSPLSRRSLAVTRIVTWLGHRTVAQSPFGRSGNQVVEMRDQRPITGHA